MLIEYFDPINITLHGEKIRRADPTATLARTKTLAADVVTVRSSVLQKLVTDFYRELDEGLKNTLTDCLQIEPSRRPPLSVLKAHLVAQLERSVAIAHNTIGY